jgi:hypothetical protein
MATFTGTLDEFHKFIGGYCRNKVQSLSKNYVRQKGRCEGEGCSHTENLQAAHITGKERPILIANILANFKEGDDFFNVDLEQFEEMYIEAHQPIEKVIKVLCKDCHRKYDNTGKTGTATQNIHKENSETTNLSEAIGSDIGVISQTILRELSENNTLSSTEIEKLCNKEYSIATLGLHFPALVKYNNDDSVAFVMSRRSHKKYRRYYKDVYIFNGQEYLLCNNWFERNRELLENWYHKIMKLY